MHRSCKQSHKRHTLQIVSQDGFESLEFKSLLLCIVCHCCNFVHWLLQPIFEPRNYVPPPLLFCAAACRHACHCRLA